MYIMDSNQYAIELVTYLLVLAIYFYELIIYMLLERNVFDSIAFFSQCRYDFYLSNGISNFLISSSSEIICPKNKTWLKAPDFALLRK